MNSMNVVPVGVIARNESGTLIKLEPAYKSALRGLGGFSHLCVIWWFDEFDHEEARSCLTVQKPYASSPAEMGVFATRSPLRPNPLALTIVEIIRFEEEQGILHISYIDANDETPVIDLKPYTPSIDRVESPAVPDWCSHWPKSLEASARFNWAAEFNY